jgi:hypothetical protein
MLVTQGLRRAAALRQHYPRTRMLHATASRASGVWQCALRQVPDHMQQAFQVALPCADQRDD